MPFLVCVKSGCKKEAYAKVAYNGKWLCLKHFKELGDFNVGGKTRSSRKRR